MSATAVDGYGDASEDWYLDVSGIGFVTNKKYRVRPKATDDASPDAYEESSYNEVVFTYDTTYPTSTILSPATTKHLWVGIPTISGTAKDNSNSEIASVEVLVKKDAGEVYWLPGDESWEGTSDDWIGVDYSTTTDYWVYTTTVPAWENNYTYRIMVRSTDEALPGGNQTVEVSSATFQYDPLKPTSEVQYPTAEYYSSMPTISGTSEDTKNGEVAGSGLNICPESHSLLAFPSE